MIRAEAGRCPERDNISFFSENFPEAMIIVVAGLPGSGKSYFASRLAVRLGAEYWNSDQVRKRLAAMGKYSLDDKLRIYEYMAQMAAAAVRAGKPAVVDATFYHHSMRDLFNGTARDCHCRIHFILVTASEAVTRERLSRPRPDSEADFGVYQSMKDLFEKFEGPHLLLHSKNDNVEEMIEVALKYLR